MANLLPPDVAQSVRSFYRGRRLIMVASVALLAALLALLGLLPSFFALHIGRASGTSRSPVSEQSPQDTAATITHARALLTALSPLTAASSSASDAITAALSLRPFPSQPEEVSIREISYQSGTPGTLILTGVADDSADINMYRRALSLDPHFTSVLVPIGALVGANGGSFNITVSGSF